MAPFLNIGKEIEYDDQFLLLTPFKLFLFYNYHIIFYSQIFFIKILLGFDFYIYLLKEMNARENAHFTEAIEDGSNLN